MTDSTDFNPTEFQKHLTAIATAVLDTHSQEFLDLFLEYTDHTLQGTWEPKEFHMAGSTSKFSFRDDFWMEKTVYIRTQEVLEWYQENVLSQTPDR